MQHMHVSTYITTIYINTWRKSLETWSALQSFLLYYDTRQDDFHIMLKLIQDSIYIANIMEILRNGRDLLNNTRTFSRFALRQSTGSFTEKKQEKPYFHGQALHHMPTLGLKVSEITVLRRFTDDALEEANLSRKRDSREETWSVQIQLFPPNPLPAPHLTTGLQTITGN